MSASNPSAAALVSIIMNLYELTEQYRKENDALLEILRLRGLRKQRLHKEMNALLDNPKPQSSADQRFAELVEQMKAFAQQNPVNLGLLAKIPVSGKPQ